MSRIILNIGLEYNSAEGLGLLDVDLVTEVIANLANGAGFLGTTVESHTEQTLVVEFELEALDAVHADIVALAEAVCNRFYQDCVALYHTGLRRGLLIGPRAAAWGPFDASKFFLLDGRSLTAEIIEELHAEVLH
jgi:hypothetical protein